MNSHNYRFPGSILAERGHFPLSKHGGKFHGASKKTCARTDLGDKHMITKGGVPMIAHAGSPNHTLVHARDTEAQIS